jgi:hypothetical protein
VRGHDENKLHLSLNLRFQLYFSQDHSEAQVKGVGVPQWSASPGLQERTLCRIARRRRNERKQSKFALDALLGPPDALSSRDDGCVDDRCKSMREPSASSELPLLVQD